MKQKLNIKSALMKAGYNGGGALAAASINKIEFVGKQKPLVRGIAKLVLGAFLPSLMGGKKNEAIEGAVAGWNGVAAIEIANAVITKNGTDPSKAISIGAIGDVNPNIMGVADASYDFTDNSAADFDDDVM